MQNALHLDLYTFRTVKDVEMKKKKPARIDWVSIAYSGADNAPAKSGGHDQR